MPQKGDEHDAIGIDHFVGSSGIMCAPFSIRQCQEIMHSQKAPDHYPISLRFTLDFVDSCSPLLRKRIGYDRNAFNDSSKCEVFESLVANFPNIGVCTDNVSHCHIVQSNIYEALCVAFPRGKIKRQAYITDNTFRYICEASAMRKRKSIFLNVFKTPLSGQFLVRGPTSLGGANGLMCGRLGVCKS